MKTDFQKPDYSLPKSEPAIAVSGGYALTKWDKGYVARNSVIHGDCLDVMSDIPNASIDMILCDLPYGTTKNSWDKVINFEKLWAAYLRIIKDNGAIVLTSQQPFATDLINSCRKLFRYEIIWEKTVKLGFLDANRKPLRGHENILVFYKSQPVYNPEKTMVKETMRVRKQSENRYDGYSAAKSSDYVNDGSRFPHSVVKFSNHNGAIFGDKTKATKHPTQKPVPLFAWLIKMFTNEGDLVLDSCLGSGTTAIACLETNRNFIGIEKEKKYVDVSEKRIEDCKRQISERLF